MFHNEQAKVATFGILDKIRSTTGSNPNTQNSLNKPKRRLKMKTISEFCDITQILQCREMTCRMLL